ncbi:MAG: fibronectin type III domain-containing protein, partial [bacterium]|nr:fibronectin type III domain-containing protein [bacterium]
MNTSDEKLNIDPKKLKSYKLKANAGFTLLELMVIMGITATIGSVSYLSISGFMARNTLELTAQELLAHLRDARQRAVSQDQSSQWGVHLKADASDIDYYEIFYGASYAGGTIVQKIVLPPAIQFLTPAQGASDDIIFMKATGKVNVSHVIVLALVNDTSVTRAINISTGNSAIEFLSTAPSFNFSLNVSPNSGTVSSGNSTAAGVDVSLLTGASQLTDFSASGLPAGVTASFSPVSCNPSCTAVMTINTLISTPPGSSAITIASTDGITTRTAIYTLTVNASPNAPRDLTATGGTGQIILNWQAPSSDGGSAITNYKIYRGTTSGGETLLTTVGNVLTYSDTSVSGGTTYYYKVSAVNGIGEGVQSNEANSI